MTVETLAFFLIGLNTSPKEFFAAPEFGQPLTANADDPEAINSEHFAVEEVEDGVRVHFPCGRHEASIDFASLTRQQITDAVLTLRRGLRQAALTAHVIGGAEESHAAKALMSSAIAESFLSLVQGKPGLNPSYVCRYVVYRAFCDPHNHPESSHRKNLTESFKRTGGWAFERIVATHYSGFLERHDVVLTRADAPRMLAAMGLEGHVPLDKIDLFVAARRQDRLIPFGIVHLKGSLAERRTNDVPASRRVIDQGYLSLFVTLDGKDTPSSNPVNKGEYGRPLVYDPRRKEWKGSQKRKVVEKDGSFSGVFSLNARTVESPEVTRPAVASCGSAS